MNKYIRTFKTKGTKLLPIIEIDAALLKVNALDLKPLFEESVVYKPNFRIGDTVVYKPSLSKKMIKQYYGTKRAGQIGRRAKITSRQDDETISVRFHKEKRDVWIHVRNLKLIKAVPRHPLTTIFK